MIPFFDMFPFCGAVDTLAGALKDARVLSASVDRANLTMTVTALLPAPVPPVVLSTAGDVIAREYALNRAVLVTVLPNTGKERKRAADGEKVIMGRRVKTKPMPMSEVTLESGAVTVQGEVFSVASRELPKNKAWVLSFDITDNTGSLRVSRYMREENAGDVCRAVKEGMYLTVSGTMHLNSFDGEVLEPRSIVTAAKKKRTDGAEETRVELHLHTKMSAMDAVTDTKQAIKRAIEWGHPAIAVTDHGVVHSFPDAMSAAGDRIKVLYGVEGYYVNDVDSVLAAYGDVSGAAGGEIVVFDLETTGLSSTGDAITEIGAVLMKDGREIDRFQTFADPGRHIPLEITNLTGIRDEDVSGAPGQREAVEAFLRFAGGRPLCGHNAAFDVGFIYETCLREHIPFEPCYIDTLALARALMPELRSHRLNVVASALSLPEFRHHRASDDAAVTGLIYDRFRKMLAERGVTRIEDINGFLRETRAKAIRARRYRPQHIIILAKNQAGIKNLYKLVTRSHLEHFNRYPTIPKSLLMELREGLIIGSACEAGEVFSLISDHRSRLEQRRLAEFYDYLEIQPICNNAFMLSGDRPRARDEEELRDFNRRVVELGRELGKPVVATGDVHFLDPEQEIFRHVLLTAKGFEDADRSLPIYFKTTGEMLEEFSYLGEETAYEVVVKNTRLIADMCDVVSPLPPKKLFPPTIKNSAGELKSLVYGKMHELYGEEPDELITKRVETELGDILGRSYDVIYMSAQKLVADSLAHGYLVGSRGSVGSSLVAFLSGITEVNSLPPHYRCPGCRHTEFVIGQGYGCGADMPDKDCPVCGARMKKDGFDIPFETFLGIGGDKVPDIDLNFSGEYQANAHKYTTELFGPDHVFRAGTIGTVAEKTAFGYVKKYQELTGKVFSRAEETRLALGCVGVKRTTGQHPGGLVVIPQDMEITDFCPAQHPADDADADVITTHFEYHCMEDNLLKLDELGHDDPTMIKMLEDMTGVNAREIPLDDPETMAIFTSPEPLGLERGDSIIGETGTIGIPEFGTAFTRQMLRDTQPRDFDTLIRLSGFSHGTDVWAGNIRDLILSGTATVKETIGCRDDIMLYLISKGMDERLAFKFMEAVRKGAIHKGKSWPDGVVEKMRELDVPEWYIESCRKIQYLFPKAHAVAYVMMAFRIAWFKVHEPLAFYSAYFYRRSQKDGFDARMMTAGPEKAAAKIREIRNNPDATAKEEDLLTTLEACYEFYKRGFEFASLDLYKSDAVKFLIEDGKLRPPFVSVSGLGETAARDLAEHRKGMEFISVEELEMTCPKLSKAHIADLKELGALSGLPDTSQLSLFG